MRRLHWIAALGIALASRSAHADDPDYENYAASALREAEQHRDRGEYLECERAVAPVTWQLSRIDGSDLADQVEATLTACQAKRAAEDRWLKSDRCRVKVDGALATIAAPRALVPKAAKRACLALVPGVPGANDGGKACPRVELVWTTGRGVRRRALAVTDGPLADDDWCCNLTAVSAGRHGGETWVGVAGDGHPCGGGTAYEATDWLYRWDGNALTAPIDQSVGYH